MTISMCAVGPTPPYAGAPRSAQLGTISYYGAMSASELWVESYQGEVLGEALFGALAERESDSSRRHELEVLTLLERATKELAEPVFEMRKLDHGNTAATLATAAELAEAVAGMTWEDFLASIEPGTEQFRARYRELVRLASDHTEREIAETYLAHEEALLAFARRSLGREAGDPLEPVLALPHVAAAIPT